MLRPLKAAVASGSSLQLPARSTRRVPAWLVADEAWAVACGSPDFSDDELLFDMIDSGLERMSS